jgi:hypothetical protein
MPANLFVSYDHDDQNQVAGLKALAKNPNHPLDFHDHSLKEAVTGTGGKPLKYPPSDPRSKPVRDEIRAKFVKASRLLVLIGDATSDSEWVAWEINTFYDMKKSENEPDPAARIRGMRLKGSEKATTPKALTAKSCVVMNWDLEKLDEWLEAPLT